MAKNEGNAKKENKVKKHFFKDMKAELKKVIWPTQKQLVNNTIAVVVIVLIIVAIVFVLDSIFDIMNQYGITKLQSYVVEQFGEDEENIDEDDDSSSSDDTESSSESETENNSEETTEGENNTTDFINTTTTDEQNTESNEQ